MTELHLNCKRCMETLPSSSSEGCEGSVCSVQINCSVEGRLVLVKSAHLSEYLWLTVFTAVNFQVPEDKGDDREALNPQFWPLTLCMLR